jgi:hypothetical protein
MHRTAVGFELARSRSGRGASALRAALDGLGLLRGRLAAWRLARCTARATAELEPRLREDAGLAPRARKTPAFSPMADAWMR